MESKPTNDAGIYLEVVNGEAPAKQQTNLEYQGPATKKNPLSPIDPAHSDKFLKLRRMLFIVTAVAFISLLTSAATLRLSFESEKFSECFDFPYDCKARGKRIGTIFRFMNS